LSNNSQINMNWIIIIVFFLLFSVFLRWMFYIPSNAYFYIFQWIYLNYHPTLTANIVDWFLILNKYWLFGGACEWNFPLVWLICWCFWNEMPLKWAVMQQNDTIGLLKVVIKIKNKNRRRGKPSNLCWRS